MIIAAKPQAKLTVSDPLRFIAPVTDALRQSDEPVIVTGATGWLGQALVEMLANSINPERILAFSTKATELYLRDGSRVFTKALSALQELPKTNAYGVFHFAFLTKDKVAQSTPAAYISANLAIRDEVSRFIDSHDVSGLCVTSSGAVYTKDRQLKRDRSEDAYAALKVEDEEFFAERCAAKNIPLVIPRIFNMSGPHINKWTAYALSNLIHMALKKEPLVIKAKHSVLRSYAYVGDILNVILAQCLSDQTVTFDACTPDAVEIGELAKRICHVLNSNSGIVREYEPGLPEDRYLGDSYTFLHTSQQVGIPLLSMDRQIRITADDLQRRLQSF